MSECLPTPPADGFPAIKALQTTPKDPPKGLDEFVRIAGALLDIPTCAVVLRDQGRLWFEARLGLDVGEPWHEIDESDDASIAGVPLIVPDVAADPQFAESSFVKANPAARFYARIPIIVEGRVLGSLVCIDTLPRTPSMVQRAAMDSLARLASFLLAREIQEHGRPSRLGQRAETEALRESEANLAAAQAAALRFEQLFGGLPIACYTFDTEETIQEWNSTAEELWGIPAQLTFLRSVHAVTGRCGRPGEASKMARRVLGGESIQGEELMVVGLDGSRRWLLSNSLPLRDRRGEIIGGMSAQLDVTDLKRTEQDLREAKRFAEEITKSSTSLLYLYDLEKRSVVWANQDGFQLLGLESPSVMALDDAIGTLAHPEDVLTIEGYLTAFADAQDMEIRELEARCRHSNGEWRWLWHRHRIHSRREDGTPAVLIGSAQDVTDRRNAEEQLREAKLFAESLAKSSTSMIYLFDLATMAPIWSNQDISELLGYDEETIRAWGSTALANVAHPDDAQKFGEFLFGLRDASDGESREFEMRARDARGEWRWLWHRCRIYRRDDEGFPTVIIGTAQDVTERKRMEMSIRASEVRFRAVVDALQEALLVQNAAGEIVIQNRSASQMLGLDAATTTEKTDWRARWRLLQEDGSDYPVDEDPPSRALRSGVSQSGIVGLSRPDEDEKWMIVSSEPFGGGTTGLAPKVVSSFVDITERLSQERRIEEHLKQIEAYSNELEEANQRLEAQATTDGLTGLKNHRFFQDFLRREIERSERSGTPLALAMLDIDRFKAYNDDFGHQAGDEVLRRVAKALETECRAGDLAARYGGEEFVIVMPGADAEAAREAVERVRAVVARLPLPDRSVTASFGVATLGSELLDPQGLIRAADEALYQSKRGGRNRVTLWKSIEQAVG